MTTLTFMVMPSAVDAVGHDLREPPDLRRHHADTGRHRCQHEVDLPPWTVRTKRFLADRRQVQRVPFRQAKQPRGPPLHTPTFMVSSRDRDANAVFTTAPRSATPKFPPAWR